MNVFDLSGTMKIDGLDKTKDQLSKLETNVKKVQKGLKIAGAAFTAFGAGGLAVLQSTKKLNAQLGVTALTLGATTKELRDLTLETTNVTFPIDQVIASFDLLARAGIKDTEVLSATATAFDTLGDAIGMGASQVTEIMVPAMKTFRLSAEEVAGKTDMMTYMVRNSTISLEDFNTMVGYTSQDMVAAGLTIDDMAAAMMYMSDQGVEPGKVMLREWNKAVTQSQEENIALTEALGMTSEELARYKAGLEGATGLTQEYADVANEQYTLMDKLKQKWSELTLKASSFLEPLEPILAGMTAMGPLMMLLSTSAGTGAIKFALHTTALIANKVAMIASAVAIKAVTVAQWLWNAAMSANPIGIIIIAIGALIAIGVLLWKNWDKVKAKAIEIWNSIKEFFQNLWDKIVKIFKDHWEIIVAILIPVVGIALLIRKYWDPIKKFFQNLWDKVTQIFWDWWDAIKKFLAKMNPWEWMKDGWEEVKSGISAAWNWLFGSGFISEWFDKLKSFLGGQDLSTETTKAFATATEAAATEFGQMTDNVKTQVNALDEWLGGQTLSAPGVETPIIPTPIEEGGGGGGNGEDGEDGEEEPVGPSGKVHISEKTGPIAHSILKELNRLGYMAREWVEMGCTYERLVEAWGAQRAAKRLAAAGDLVYFGKGGIARKPTVAMVGDEGPEAIIPLKGLGTRGLMPELHVHFEGNTFLGNIPEEEANSLADMLIERIREKTRGLYGEPSF